MPRWLHRSYYRGETAVSNTPPASQDNNASIDTSHTDTDIQLDLVPEVKEEPLLLASSELTPSEQLERLRMDILDQRSHLQNLENLVHRQKELLEKVVSQLSEPDEPLVQEPTSTRTTPGISKYTAGMSLHRKKSSLVTLADYRRPSSSRVAKTLSDLNSQVPKSRRDQSTEFFRMPIYRTLQSDD